MKLKLFQRAHSSANANASYSDSTAQPTADKSKINDLKKVPNPDSPKKGLFGFRRKNNTPILGASNSHGDSVTKREASSGTKNSGLIPAAKSPASILSLPAVVHEYVLSELLDPADWSRLSQVCTVLQAPYSRRIATYKDTKIDEVAASKLIPPAIFNDPLFQKYPPNYKLLAKILNRASPVIKMLLSKGVKAWQVAALLGMEGALHATYGDGLRDLKDGHDYTVEHYYMVTNDRMLVRSHFTRYRPFFKATTPEDYGFAEIAAAAGSVDILDMFRKSYGFDLNRLNTELDITLIHCAIEFGQGGTVRWLIEHNGVDPRQGRNVLLASAEHGRLACYNYFIRMQIFARNQTENNELLVRLAHCGATDLIEKSLVKNGVEKMRAVNHEGDTIFSSAVCGGQYDTVMFCVQNGLGKIDHRWSKNWTNLHIAALEGQFTLIRQLLKEFPDLLSAQMVDDDGRTMLFYAGMFGDADEFFALVTDGIYTDADCLKQDVNGISIVHAACEAGKLEFVKRFISKFGKDCLKQTDNRGLTALHYACISHNLELIEWLIAEHKLSLASTDSLGKTPLHYLAENALENPALNLWEDIPALAEKFGIEYITDFLDSSGHSVKDYIERAVDQSKILAAINRMCYHRQGDNPLFCAK